MARIATGYLIFNGYLWKETREPTYGVGSNNPRRVRLMESTDRYPEHRRFRLDRLADAERFAWRLPDTETVAIDEAVLDFYPSRLVRDDRLEVARELGQIVLQAAEKWLPLFDPAGTAEFIELRRRIGSNVDHTTTGMPASRLLDVIEALPLNAHGKEVATTQLKALTPVLIRWSEFEGGSLTTPVLSEADSDLLAAIG